MFSRASPCSGETRLFRLKLTKAFLTGSIPTDYRSLNPRILISI
jgi:hypothetical protein